jgi:hypothetical protein
MLHKQAFNLYLISFERVSLEILQRENQRPNDRAQRVKGFDNLGIK